MSLHMRPALVPEASQERRHWLSSVRMIVTAGEPQKIVFVGHPGYLGGLSGPWHVGRHSMTVSVFRALFLFKEIENGIAVPSSTIENSVQGREEAIIGPAPQNIVQVDKKGS